MIWGTLGNLNLTILSYYYNLPIHWFSWGEPLLTIPTSRARTSLPLSLSLIGHKFHGESHGALTAKRGHEVHMNGPQTMAKVAIGW